METFTPEKRLMRARVALMNDPRFIAVAGIMQIGTCKIIDDFPTAVTNGKDVAIGLPMMEQIDDAELRFVLMHEYYHIMLMHLTNWRHLFDEDQSAANTATDIVINNMLDHQSRITTVTDADGKVIQLLEIRMPKNIPGPMDHQYDGMDTGEVFRKIKEQQQQQQGGKGKGKGKQGGGTPMPGGFDKHDTEGAEEGMAPLTEEEVKELHQQIDTVIRQGAQMAGKLGGKVDRSLTDLLEVTVRWQEVLQEWVKQHMRGTDLSTWRRPHRRWMTRDLYMPSHYSEQAECLVLTVDTSGSIGGEQLRRAMTEIKGACDVVTPRVVHVIYWDHDVAGHEIYEDSAVAQITEVTKPKGGGGTRVGCVKQYIIDKGLKPDAIITFTDGYVEGGWAGAEGWPAPVLWCVSVKGMVAPYGKTLYVPVTE